MLHREDLTFLMLISLSKLNLQKIPNPTFIDLVEQLEPGSQVSVSLCLIETTRNFYSKLRNWLESRLRELVSLLIKKLTSLRIMSFSERLVALMNLSFLSSRTVL